MKPSLQRFVQDMHCCGDDDEASLAIEVHDGGGGEYLVINATQWALDGEADLKAMVKAIRGMLPKA